MASRRRRRSFRRFKRRDREYVWCTTVDALTFQNGPHFVQSASAVLCAGSDLMPSDLDNRRSHEVTLLRTVGLLSLGWVSQDQFSSTPHNGEEFDQRQYHYQWYIAKFHDDESFSNDLDEEDVVISGVMSGTAERRVRLINSTEARFTLSDVAGSNEALVDTRNRRKLSGLDTLSLVTVFTDPLTDGTTEADYLYSQMIYSIRTLWLVT